MCAKGSLTDIIVVIEGFMVNLRASDNTVVGAGNEN